MARRRIVPPIIPGSEDITHPAEVMSGGLEDARIRDAALSDERARAAEENRYADLDDDGGVNPMNIRNPEGNINNCAIALSLPEGEEGCQICMGTCPDKKRLIGGELAKVVKQASIEQQHGRARKRFDFEVAQAAKMSPLRPDVARVVEMVFVDDVAKSYRRLEDELSLGDDKHSRHGEVIRALDRAESNARMAHKCYVTARVEREAWELRNHVVFAAMWLSATQALQEEKTSGARNKQITDADVRAKAAAIFGDEWASQEIQRKEAEAMVDDFKNLAERWASRCWGLSTMLGKTR